MVFSPLRFRIARHGFTPRAATSFEYPAHDGTRREPYRALFQAAQQAKPASPVPAKRVHERCEVSQN
jgi:hypothetical protein